jgi:hypothetical protein
MKTPFSRRSILKGAAASFGAAALAGPATQLFGEAQAQTAEHNAVLLVYLEGGYNALFGSPLSFVPTGDFGCTATNIRSMGNNLYIDNATYGLQLPPVALSNIAQLGVNHRLSSHFPARTANFSNNNSRSHALLLAKEMGASAGRLSCAVVGSIMPFGPRPAEGGVSMQQVTDVGPALDLAGVTKPPSDPSRSTTAAALTAARTMSTSRLNGNLLSLKTAKESYDSALGVLTAPTLPALTETDFNEIKSRYGVTTGSAQAGFASQMMAAETMIRMGSRVVIAVHPGWDTHTDSSGLVVRNKMTSQILPSLSKFLTKMMPLAGFNVTTAIFGDFARSLPNSDHAACLSATVMGKRVKIGSTGNVSATVGMATTVPGVAGFWSYLSDAARVAVNPFGANPHAQLLLP